MNWDLVDPRPTLRFQAIWKAGAAVTCSIDCSGVPPGSGQASSGVAGGRKKPTPCKAGATLTC